MAFVMRQKRGLFVPYSPIQWKDIATKIQSSVWMRFGSKKYWIGQKSAPAKMGSPTAQQSYTIFCDAFSHVTFGKDINLTNPVKGMLIMQLDFRFPNVIHVHTQFYSVLYANTVQS